MTIFRSKSISPITTLCGVGIFVSTLFLFLVTRYPTVAYIDSGELAVVAGSLGIAHPTGYPLYTLLGRLFALLPFELMTTQIFFAALCVAAAMTILYFALSRYFRVTAMSAQLTLAGGVLLLGCAPLIWSQGTTNEVYSLHLLFLSLIVALLLADLSARRLVIGAYVVGLAFGNHMSTILLLPTIAYYLFINRHRLAEMKKILLLVAGVVALAASAYLYLPVRAAQDPIFNWGQPSTWGNFVRHVTGWQYQVWMFSQTGGQLLDRLVEFTRIFYAQFPLPYWGLVVAGLVSAWRSHRHVVIMLLCLVAFNCLYALNFQIPDIDNYLLPSILALFVLGLLGLRWIVARWRMPEWSGGLLVAALIVWGLAVNWEECDQSENFAALDGVHNLNASAETGALIFCADWDFVSPWFYSHFYLRERPDVLVIDNELARRSWYFDFIRHADSTLYGKIKPEIEQFLPHVRRFERKERYDGKLIEATYQKLLMSMLQYQSRPAYVETSANLAFPPPGRIVSSGQLFRILREGESQIEAKIVLSAPRFGKPAQALSVRERVNLEKYELMQKAALQAPPNQSSSE